MPVSVDEPRDYVLPSQVHGRIRPLRIPAVMKYLRDLSIPDPHVPMYLSDGVVCPEHGILEYHFFLHYHAKPPSQMIIRMSGTGRILRLLRILHSPSQRHPPRSCS